MVQQTENPEKSQKNLKYSHFSFFFYFFFAKKKNAILLVSNLRRTRFDQSSPVQPVSEIRKSQKISKHHLKKIEEENNAILLVFQY